MLLQGAGVIVTRPAAQAGQLCRLLAAQGAVPIRFPVLAIEPAPEPAAIMTRVGDLAAYDWAIFISANAVEWALKLYQNLLPDTLRLAVIGPASARALRQFGYRADLVPAQGFDSEALLALPAMQAAAIGRRRIVIFRASGGRGVLGDSLRGRGAEVVYAEVYRRVRPTPTAADLAALLQAWRQRRIQAATAASNESLANLFDLVGEAGQAYLRATPLVVYSERAKRLAQELKWRNTVAVAADTSDQGMLVALQELPAQKVGVD